MYKNKVILHKCLLNCLDKWFNGLHQPNENLKYIGGFKFQIIEDFIISIEGLNLDRDIKHEFMEFYTDGTLILKRGFAWDGPSGMTIQTKNSMIPSAVHDALYRLIRYGYLPLTFKPISDKIFYKLLLRYGMHPWRAYVWFLSVRLFGMEACITPARIIEIVKKI